MLDGFIHTYKSEIERWLCSAGRDDSKTISDFLELCEVQTSTSKHGGTPLLVGPPRGGGLYHVTRVTRYRANKLVETPGPLAPATGGRVSTFSFMAQTTPSQTAYTMLPSKRNSNKKRKRLLPTRTLHRDSAVENPSDSGVPAASSGNIVTQPSQAGKGSTVHRCCCTLAISVDPSPRSCHVASLNNKLVDSNPVTVAVALWIP